MLKKLKRIVSKFLYALPFGLKAGDEIMTAPTSDGSEGAGIHQQKQTKSVWADLLQEKLTEEAIAIRYTMYKAEEKSNEYKYVGGGRTRKVDKPVNLKKFKMGNIDLDYTGEESLEMLNNGNFSLTAIPKRKAIKVTCRNSVNRFNIENYINSICVNLNTQPMTIELRFINDMQSRFMRPFLNYVRGLIKKINEAPNEEVVVTMIKKEDILSGIDNIEFSTYGCSNNVPNGIHYVLKGIKFKEFNDGKEYLSITYTVDNYEDGQLLSDKYYSEKQDQRYKKKEAKKNGAALIDVASASKSLEEKNEQDTQNTNRHCSE